MSSSEPVFLIRFAFGDIVVDCLSEHAHINADITVDARINVQGFPDAPHAEYDSEDSFHDVQFSAKKAKKEATRGLTFNRQEKTQNKDIRDTITLKTIKVSQNIFTSPTGLLFALYVNFGT